MLPLYDENPTRSKPFVTWSIILINVVIFIWEASSGSYEQIIIDYGEIPAFVTRGEKPFTFMTSIFLHGDLFHIFGNMLYLHGSIVCVKDEWIKSLIQSVYTVR
ncbi:MAG: rhomboid family intramembrane serine protease [Nitrososphaerales archaeon]|nr:rhomboid family intramembrane serine protease [Nitrososphaerales archaeon]